MKKSEIKIGHIYSNGKGRLRKVIDIGPQYKLYDGQRCDENMRIRGHQRRKQGEQNCRRTAQHDLAAFASWCKEEVE